MLKLIDITKEYKVDEESILALHGVSIEFRKNEFVSILGPSGCGKTTLLNIIGGLDRYTSGDIQIDGVSTKEYDDIDWDTYRNRRIGFVFQSYNLIPHMNILKNVAMGLTLAGVEREERRQRALEALKKVGLESQARKKPNQLSGGQMQRVAIARALVNNPEIILADEPTGALDSESGIQVMDLLKEVAQDRLVIMVTHNPSLAEEYSTRIVYLKDGEVEGDTMPYVTEDDNPTDNAACTDAQPDITEDRNAEAAQDDNLQEAVNESGIDKKKVKKPSRFRLKMLKRREKDNSSMKLSTAISLSWNNLLSKKGRTFLTSIAGSIGIIGIILVLSLSNGARMYIKNLEESALSNYPLTISQTNLDINSILSMIMRDDENRPEHPNSDTVYIQKVLGKILDQFEALMEPNDLYSLKKYIDKNFDKSLATVRYNYGTTFNAYITDPNNDKLVAEGKEERYMKVNPYTETMDAVIDSLPDKIKDFEVNGMSLPDAFKMFTGSGSFNSWAEMSSNTDLLNAQYELVGSKSRWPQTAEEVVIVVDEKNQLQDYQLFMLGLKSQDDVVEAINNGAFSSTDYNLDELLSLKYEILTNADYLESNGDGTWTQHTKREQNKAWVDGHKSLTCRVVGVIRPKAGAAVTSINGVIGYTSALTQKLIDLATEHEAIKAVEALYTEALQEGYDSYKSIIEYEYYAGEIKKSVSIGDWIYFGEGQDTHTPMMRNFGVVDTDYPTSIDFFCASFEAKERIVEFINRYNEENDQNVRYGDTLSTIMGFVNTMADTITGVLIAFAAISLIVSTIMIAIIIYTSVLERRKEIGVLRSIGARKKDISRVFLAESAILGGYSGVIGLIVSSIIAVIGSKILQIVFEIEGLMTLSWWQCLVMFVISVLLSMFAGFIPSRIASNKDPAIALRSE